MHWTWWLYWLDLVTLARWLAVEIHLLYDESIRVSHLAEFWICCTSHDVLPDCVRSVSESWTVLADGIVLEIVFLGKLLATDLFTLASESYTILSVEFLYSFY
jgi:hypothetical protein